MPYFKKAKWIGGATAQGIKDGDVVYVGESTGRSVWVSLDPDGGRGFYASPSDIQAMSRNTIVRDRLTGRVGRVVGMARTGGVVVKFANTVTIKTNKGNKTGSVEECAAWIETMQPAFASVVVNGAESHLSSPPGDWTRANAAAAIRDEID